MIDPESYFRNKGSIEIERKALNIDRVMLETRLISTGCIKLFSGTATSEYYYSDPTEIYGPLFALRILSGGLFILGDGTPTTHWIRLRTMEDKNGTKIYSIETKYPIMESEKKFETGRIVTSEEIEDIRTVYQVNSRAIKLKQTEVKYRDVFVIADGESYVPGIEFDIDEITNPIKIEPYLEIEVDKAELLNRTIEISGIPKEFFIRISSRKIIETRL